MICQMIDLVLAFIILSLSPWKCINMHLIPRLETINSHASAINLMTGRKNRDEIDWVSRKDYSLIRIDTPGSYQKTRFSPNDCGRAKMKDH